MKTQNDPLPERNWFMYELLFGCLLLFGGFMWLAIYQGPPSPDRMVPNIEIAYMNFTVTKIPTSAKWDLLIRTPPNLVGNYICLEGDLQASIIYKHIVVATSLPQRYNNFKPLWPHLLRVSVVASRNDISDVTGIHIFDDIVKERGEVRFGSQLDFPDCREKTKGTMSFACDEAVLRFDSSSQTMTTSKNPTCLYHDPS